MGIKNCPKPLTHAKVFDWLCMNVPESDLPEGFDPGQGNFEVIVSSFKKNPKSEDETSSEDFILLTESFKENIRIEDEFPQIVGAYVRCIAKNQTELNFVPFIWYFRDLFSFRHSIWKTWKQVKKKRL